MTSIKKWVTKGTGYEGEDSFFPLKEKAINHAKKILLSGKKSTVWIGKFSEKRYKEDKPLRSCYPPVEEWGFVASRRIGRISKLVHKE